MTYNSEVLADSPIHYFKLDETSGTTFANAGSNGYTTSLNKGTGVTLNESDSISGKACTFDGSANSNATAFSLYGQYPSSGTTIEVWYKGTDTGTIARWGSGSSSWAVNVVSGGYVQFNWGVTGTYTASTGAVNDGQWHHIVCSATNSSGTYQIWVDKTKVLDSGAGQSVGNFSSNGDLYIGDNSTSAIAGKIDEFAVYNSVLSSTRIAAHYDAAPLPTNVTIDVATQTATAQANDVTLGQSIVDVATATATGTANDVSLGLGSTNTVATLTATADVAAMPTRAFATPTRDASTDESGTINYGISSVTLTGTGATMLLVDFDLPADWTDAGQVKTFLQLTFSDTGAGTISVAPITAEYTDSDITHTHGSFVAVGSTPTGTGSKSFDVSSLTTKPFYGFLVRSDLTRIVQTSEGANAPKLIADYVVVPHSETIDVSTVTGTALANDVTVTGSALASQSTATASSSAYDVTVVAEVTPDSDNTVETVTASATANNVIVGLPTTVDVTAVTATAGASDVTVETTSGAIVDVTGATSTATVIGLTDVNGEPIVPTEEEDPYFLSTMFLNPTVWFRMNITSGTTEVPRVGSELFSGKYINANIGLNGGPNGRKYVHFNGTSMFEQLEANDEGYDYNGTLEFSIRTTKKNQFVMRMDDYRRAIVAGGANKDTPSRDLYLVDGKLQYQVWNSTPEGPVADYMTVGFTGTTDLADGEWHHVILASSMETGTVTRPSTGKVDVYIDGKLEIRRTTYGFSFPDYIGGRPGYSWPEYLAVPVSRWFEGDMTEVVYFDRAHFNEDQVNRQNDTIYGYDPVYVETARSVAEIVTDASVKTNAKRVLTINMGVGTKTLYMSGAPQGFSFAGLAYAGSNNTTGIKVGDYQVFQYNIQRPDNAPAFTDFVTDEYRLLDLDQDLDLDDFDIINVINFPMSSDDWDYYKQWDRPALFGGLTGRQQVEKMLDRIKQFAVDGGGLFVTDPGLAVYLGIVDRIEYVPTLREPKKAVDTIISRSTSRDLRAARINPWGSNPNGANSTIWEPRPTPGPQPGVNYDYLANYYDDEHANNNQRVRKAIAGLTDIAGSVLVDAIAFSAANNAEFFAEKWDDKPDGLAVGDEFRWMGSAHSGRGGSWYGTAYGGGPVSPFMRYYGTVAAPIANVKAGTVVTSFGSKEWVEDVLVDNPYKDYALSIAVEPGSTLGGQVVQGRIFVNFSESFADLAPELMHGVRDLIPENTAPYFETAESREWDWSMWRGAWAGSGNTDNDTSVTIDNNGNVTISQKKDGLQGITYTPRYQQERMPAPTMHYRGLKWIGDNIDTDGNAAVSVESVTASATAIEPSAEAQRSVATDLVTVRANAKAEIMADLEETSADVLVFTAEASAAAGSFREVIDLSTATASAEAHGDSDTAYYDAQVVVLRFPTASALLHMEDS